MADKTEWQLAPTEQTEEMVRAGMKRMFDEKRYSAPWDDVIHLMYCDMVKAAPKPDYSGDAAEMVTAAPPPAGAQQAVALSDDEIDRLQEEYDCFGQCDAPRIHDFARGVEKAVLALAAPAAAQGAPSLPEPVLCVSSKEFKRMRAGDHHVKAWLPPLTNVEDMALFSEEQMRAALAATPAPEAAPGAKDGAAG